MLLREALVGSAFGLVMLAAHESRRALGPSWLPSRDGRGRERCARHASCALRGMTNPNTPPPRLPHHKLLAYGAAVELLQAVKAANIRDTNLRDQAMRAAKSTCLNCAEGAGRWS